MRKIAIIGGTGVYSPDALAGFEEKVIATPYGDALCKIGTLHGNQVVFITRHGVGHSVPPHKVNYRANIWALKSLGTEEIFATTAVGSLNREMKAGHFVVCDQAIDFTKSRVNTFYDTPCPRLRAKVIKCLEKTAIPFHKTGCYVCTEGPRFETAAEIKMFAMLGGDLVGMTNLPESVLAREAEMCYTNCSIVTNMAAGISPTPLSHSEVVATAKLWKQWRRAAKTWHSLLKPLLPITVRTAKAATAHTAWQNSAVLNCKRQPW